MLSFPSSWKVSPTSLLVLAAPAALSSAVPRPAWRLASEHAAGALLASHRKREKCVQQRERERKRGNEAL